MALLFAICMKVLLATLTEKSPKWQLQESIIGTNPGNFNFFYPISFFDELTSLFFITEELLGTFRNIKIIACQL